MKFTAKNTAFWGTATALALATALISGTNNFLAKIAVNALKDPIAFTTVKNGVVAVILVGLLVAFNKRQEIADLTKHQWIRLVLIGVIGGSIPFAMFFTGLSMTAAVNAAFIHKTLFIWVALLAIPLLKERISPLQWLGIAAIFTANLVIGGFKGFKFDTGELLVLGATMFWAIENIIAKITLKDVSALTVTCARMVFGSVVLSGFLLVTGRFPDLTAITATQWSWTMLTSLLLLGYVITWYSALKRAPVTYVATLLVPAVMVTNILSAIFVTHSFPLKQAVGLGLFVAGAAWVIMSARATKPAVTNPAPANG
ncbi:DMT family transporter [Patescibacteria group bacterium]